MLNQKITTNTKHITNGDVFFCFKTAEKYLNYDILNKVSKIFCESGFFERIEQLNIFTQDDINNYKDIIFEKENLKDFLVETLQSTYKIPENIIAITGTKGKTSTAWFTMQIIGELGFKCGYIGTVGAYIYDKNITKINTEDTLTTPSIDDLYFFLNEFSKNSCNFAVFEASSHALQQRRLDGIHVNCGIFTNLSQDHLDYHKTMDEYFNAKTILFSKYQKKGDICVLNADDDRFEQLKNICKKNDISIHSVSKNKNTDFIIKSIEQQKTIQSVEFEFNGHIYTFQTHILGEFQIYNIIQAIIACHFMTNKNLQDICDIVKNISAPIGRMQQVKNTNIFVDFAHTPKSLEESIKLLKSRYKNVITVFGCGGNRDKTKRPIMCEVACKLSNFVVITSDNPRFENPESIIQDILCFKKHDSRNPLYKDEYVINEIKKIDEKYNNEDCNFIEIIDRKEAIKYAVENYLNREDTAVVIAGKGHENYQIINDVKHHFSDFEEIEKYI